MATEWKQIDTPFLRQAASTVLVNSLWDLDAAYQRLFEGKHDGRLRGRRESDGMPKGYPRSKRIVIGRFEPTNKKFSC
jgi:hypothetical protein